MNNKAVNLCVITTVPFTMQVFFLDQLVYLSANGFKITVVCDNDPGFNLECPPELEYVPVAMTRDISVLGTIKSFIKLLMLFKNKHFDMVQYTTPKAALLSSVAARIAGVPVRVYCQWGMRYVGMSGLPRRIFRFIEKITCYFSTDIVPDSFGNLSCALDEDIFPAQKGSVVHKGSANGVNLQKFDINQKTVWCKKIRNELGISNNAFVYGFVGRITRDKGISELMKAFQRLYDESPDIYLVMVGPKDENHGLDISVLNLLDQHENIKKVGFQKNPNEYMAACDVMVLPSYREGFGMVAIESQALGVPVIATDIPGPREAVVDGRTGVIIIKGEVEQLYQSMLNFKNNPALVKQMGHEGYSFVKANFEQEDFWRHMLEHRLELLRKRIRE